MSQKLLPKNAQCVLSPLIKKISICFSALNLIILYHTCLYPQILISIYVFQGVTPKQAESPKPEHHLRDIPSQIQREPSREQVSYSFFQSIIRMLVYFIIIIKLSSHWQITVVGRPLAHCELHQLLGQKNISFLLTNIL